MVVGIAVARSVLAFPAIEEDVAVHAAADLTIVGPRPLVIAVDLVPLDRLELKRTVWPLHMSTMR
jgi:hypothetical protein